MPAPDSFIESPTGTREEIMRATYLALGEHGYADLTIQAIADEFEKSKSLIYHHYDGKDELLLDFLEFMLERFEDTVPFEDAEGADEHLRAVLDHALGTPHLDDRRDFTAAMVELRAQAAHDERYREHFTWHDRFFADRLETVLEMGVAEKTFRDVDPERAATFLVTAINGALTGRVTSEDDPAEAVRAQLDEYLDAVLLDAV